MRIRPLQGQVLVLLLPRDEKIGEIFIPDIAHDTKPTHDNIYVKRGHRKGIVQEVGNWKKTRTGLAILPDVKRGDTVMLNDYTGTRLTQGVDDNLRLIQLDEILAVLTGD